MADDEVPYDIGQRMRAARQLAGYQSVPLFADVLKGRGVKMMGATKLHQFERGELVPTFAELREVAEACGVPIAWFSADFSRLVEISDDPRAVLAQRLADAAARAEERRSGRPEDPQSRQAEDQ